MEAMTLTRGSYSSLKSGYRLDVRNAVVFIVRASGRLASNAAYVGAAEVYQQKQVA